MEKSLTRNKKDSHKCTNEKEFDVEEEKPQMTDGKEFDAEEDIIKSEFSRNF